MPLRWSQSLGEEPGCSWGGARDWGRSLGVPGVEPEPGLAKGPTLPGSATLRA